jgi:pyruvate formate lyase activating enzyme
VIKDTVPGRYWHLRDDGRIQCDLCPRYCHLKEGQRGLCFVRARQGDPLNHFLPGTAVFSFGTAGCNLACKFCQNWDISKSREIDTLAASASPENIAATAKRLGCRSVA